MSDATSILDLPTDPIGGGNVSNNITISAQEIVKPQQSQQNQNTDTKWNLHGRRSCIGINKCTQ